MNYAGYKGQPLEFILYQDGEDATSYWIATPCTVHTGKAHGQNIVVTAMKKVGTNEEEVDTGAYLWWRYSSTTTWARAAALYRINFTFPTEVLDDDILIIATHIQEFDPNADGVDTNTDIHIYEREEIPFSPLNTPIINLTNDSAALAYKIDGSKIDDNDTVSTTAEVWLNGSKLTSGVSYEWRLSDCTTASGESTVINTDTITIKDLTENTATATCIATYKSVSYTKVFTITKQFQGGKGDTGDSIVSQYAYMYVTAYPSSLLDPVAAPIGDIWECYAAEFTGRCEANSWYTFTDSNQPDENYINAGSYKIIYRSIRTGITSNSVTTWGAWEPVTVYRVKDEEAYNILKTSEGLFGYGQGVYYTPTSENTVPKSDGSYYLPGEKIAEAEASAWVAEDPENNKDKIKLYINAEYIKTGTLTVGDPSSPLLQAGLDGDGVVTIGGWTVNSNSISSGTLGQPNSAFLSAKGVGANIGDTYKSNWGVTLGSNFGVDLNGNIQAKSGKIGGFSLNSNSISAGSKATDNYIKLSSDTVGDLPVLETVEGFDYYFDGPSSELVIDPDTGEEVPCVCVYSNNNGKDYSDAVSKLTFNNDNDKVVLYICSSAEEGYDYTIVSTVNAEDVPIVAESYTCYASTKDCYSSEIKKVTYYKVKRGDYIYLVFSKDVSNNYASDEGRVYITAEECTTRLTIGDNFHVNSKGYLTATAGKIGGFELTNTSLIATHLYNDNNNDVSTSTTDSIIELHTNPDDLTEKTINNVSDKWIFSIGETFGITPTGHLNINTATIGDWKLSEQGLSSPQLQLNSQGLTIWDALELESINLAVDNNYSKGYFTADVKEFYLTTSQQDNGFYFTRTSTNQTWNITWTFRLSDNKVSLTPTWTSIPEGYGDIRKLPRTTTFNFYLGKQPFVGYYKEQLFSITVDTASQLSNGVTYTTKDCTVKNTTWDTIWLYGETWVDDKTSVTTSTSHRIYLSGGVGINYSYSSILPAKSSINLGSATNPWTAAYLVESNIRGNQSFTSDARVKTNVNYDLSKYDSFFDDLKPATYQFTYGTSGRTHFGLLAQEVEQGIFKNNLTRKDISLVDIQGEGFDVKTDTITDINKTTYGLRYSELHALEIYQIQSLKKRVIELESKIEELLKAKTE